MGGSGAGIKYNIPCKLLEYFQATPAVETAPIMPPTALIFAASLAVLSWKEERKIAHQLEVVKGKKNRGMVSDKQKTETVGSSKGRKAKICNFI